MHLFITGASGFIGTAVARQLLAAGHTLTGVARSDASAGRLAAAGVAVERGDLEDVGSLAGAMRNADGIVHIAVGGPRGVTDADERVVAAMIDALAGRDAPLIVTSGVGVYAGIGLPFVDEDTPLDNPIPPQAPRVRLEAQTVAAAARGVRAMVLRPAHAYGAGGSSRGFRSTTRRAAAPAVMWVTARCRTGRFTWRILRRRMARRCSTGAPAGATTSSARRSVRGKWRARWPPRSAPMDGPSR